jgi:nicotinate-nucleotide pyrophosphorylase (carboxylating)
VTEQFIQGVVAAALREDVGTGDLSSESAVPAVAFGRAEVVSREAGVLAGLTVLREVFRQVDSDLSVTSRLQDGDHLRPGESIGTVEGTGRSILTAERVALNFLQRLSGIATVTARFVEQVAGTGARIVDTRKTTPGLRALEKYAVRVGGGFNHRMGLYDAVMIKDNHIVAAGGITPAVKRARAQIPHTMTITVECETLKQVDEALAAGADILLLDNMDNPTRAEAVRRARSRALTEASGGITLETVADVARTGVDIISVGALTHSAPALDISLDFLDISLAES